MVDAREALMCGNTDFIIYTSQLLTLLCDSY